MPTNTNDRATWFGGSPQSLVGDLIREGLTGVAGQVSEPYLQSAVRPDVLFPAYLAGFNLVESFYLAIPHLSWQTVVIGDPLCAPFARRPLTRADIDGGIDARAEPAGVLRQADAWPKPWPACRAHPRAAARLLLRAETCFGTTIGRRAPEAARAGLGAGAQRGWRSTSSWPSCTRTAGEPELAAERYRKVIALQPTHATALNNLAYDMAVREKKPAEALPMARKALALAPDNATILDTVGWIEFLLGNNAEAARLLVHGRQGCPAQRRDSPAQRDGPGRARRPGRGGQPSSPRRSSWIRRSRSARTCRSCGRDSPRRISRRRLEADQSPPLRRLSGRFQTSAGGFTSISSVHVRGRQIASQLGLNSPIRSGSEDGQNVSLRGCS